MSVFASSVQCSDHRKFRCWLRRAVERPTSDMGSISAGCRKMTIFVQARRSGRCSKRRRCLPLLRARMENMYLWGLNVVLMFAHRQRCVIAPFDGTVSCVFLSCCGSAASSYCRLMARSRLSYFPDSGHCERLAVLAAVVGLQRCAFRLQFCLVWTKAYSRRK